MEILGFHGFLGFLKLTRALIPVSFYQQGIRTATRSCLDPDHVDEFIFMKSEQSQRYGVNLEICREAVTGKEIFLM